MSTTYAPVPASDLVVGDRVRPLAAVGPSVPKDGAEDFPLTVARLQVLNTAGDIRVWAHPHGSRVSTTSAAVYGRFQASDVIERADT